jgi:hypothetical protein
MSYRTYRKIEDKLQLILPFVVLGFMLYLASGVDRRNYSPTYLEQKVIFEAKLEKAIARDKENLNRKIPMVRRLDDGIQGDIPIQDLMKGLKGYL